MKGVKVNEEVFFTESIAPISYEVKLLRFPIETVVKEFEKWASGFDSPYAKPYLYRVKSWVVVYLFSNLGLVSWRWFRGHLGDKG